MNPPGVQIRRATPGDAPSLRDLFRQLGYEAEAASVRERVWPLARDPQSRCLVATQGTSIAGMISLYFVPVLHQGGHWCRVTAVVVDARARGQGIGQALMAAAEEEARSCGCVRIEATSALGREDAHRFYERLGYTQLALHFLKEFGKPSDGQR